MTRSRARSTRRPVAAAWTAVVLAVALLLNGCASGDPLAGAGGSNSVVIGSQDYYSNEIIAEIYAQALESEGFTVDRQFRIGQREAYLPEIEKGGIDLVPEYTGPLLQYWDPKTTARLPQPVYQDLKKVTPKSLRVLNQSPATDQDSYVVTQEFAQKWGLTSIGDLAKVKGKLVMGANSEAEKRPNGPLGLQKVYGIKSEFTPIEDGGGPLTVKALKDDSIQLAIIYTADPSIPANKLVPLKDPKGLFLASHVVPLAGQHLDDRAAEVINKISAAMSPQDLVMLNARSVTDELPADTIAKDWLAQKNPLKK